jgi:oxygen-independent coproporphyrinogen-3 oxidase
VADVSHYLRPGTLHLPKLPPLSLYVHLPWCIAKCPYCDFNSHAMPRDGALPEARTIDALVADLEASLPLVWGRPVVSVFIGGGTPSLFSPASIERLLGAVRALLPVEPGAEVTLEANPGTFERDRFRAFGAAGVTRLSLGVQSFDDAALQQLGRVHDGTQARAAAAEAAEVFETWNLDLMTGLPGQTEAGAVADASTALGFAPPHVSLYQLTIEPNTVFAKFPPARLPDADTQSRLLDAAAEPLAAAGLRRYEVSAHARDGHRSVHNVNYWMFGDYLGIGAGAHGKLSFPHRVVRQARRREPQAWLAGALAGDAVAESSEVERKALPFEFMLNALRLREGVPLTLFGERTGLPPSAIARPLDEAERRGLLERSGGHLRPTPLGFDFLSDLQQLFLP